MLVDIMTEIMNMRVCIAISENLGRNDLLEKKHADFICKYMDDITSRFGSKGFDMIGDYESIAVAVILKNGTNEI
jgi:hypothetical protein